MTIPPPVIEERVQETSMIAVPAKKKEVAKAWLFTLLLHVIVASGLIAYWYYNQHTNHTDTIAMQLPKDGTQDASVATSVVELPASVIASTALNVTTPALTASAVTPALVESVAASDAKRPLANYVAKQIVSRQVLVPTPQAVVTTPQTPPVADRALTTRDVPAKETTAKFTATTESASKTAAASASQQPTVPALAQTKAEQAATHATTTKPASNTIANTTGNTNSHLEKQAAQLTQELDASNDQISQLIDQIKKRNQQQIDTRNSSTTETTSAASSPTP